MFRGLPGYWLSSQAGKLLGMTKTERLLRQARAIAERAFGDPSEEAVLRVFDQLCLEVGAQDGAAPDEAGQERTVH